MVKRLYIDVETTGTNEKVNGIHQISGYIEIDNKIKESFNFKIRPFEGCIIEPKAIEVSNVTEEEIKNNPLSETEVYEKLMTLLTKYVSKYDKKDKFFFVGYNANFDKNFMSEFWLRQNDKYFFSLVWGNIIDVMVLATDKLEDIRHEMEDFKLMTVAKKFGIVLDEKKLHDASYDIEITRDLLYIIKGLKNEKPIVSVNYSDNEIISSKDFPLFFGKYNNKTIEEVIKIDSGYLKWIAENGIKGIKFSEEILNEINSKPVKYQNNKKEESKAVPIPEFNTVENDSDWLNNPDVDLPF